MLFEEQPKVNTIATTKKDSQIIIVIVSPQTQMMMMMMMMMMSLKSEEHADHIFSKKVCSFTKYKYILFEVLKTRYYLPFIPI